MLYIIEREREVFWFWGREGESLYTCYHLNGVIPNTVFSRMVVPDVGIFHFLEKIGPLHSP